jgi:TPR repeat protein
LISLFSTEYKRELFKAKLGNTDSLFYVAQVLEKNSEAESTDYLVAIIRYCEAAKKGHKESQYKIAEILSDPKIDPQSAISMTIESSLTKAEINKFLIAAGDHGSFASYYKLANSANSYELRTEWLIKAAEAGSVDAARHLSVRFMNDKTATNYWRNKAANLGDGNAQFLLGTLYEEGEGVTQNYQDAEYWYEKASAADGQKYDKVNDAKFRLASLYLDGNGSKSKGDGFKLMEEVANHGHADAQNTLGILYLTGNSVILSYEKALLWFQKSANQDNKKAQYNLAYMYAFGLGVAQNIETAKDYFRQSSVVDQSRADEDGKIVFFKGIENVVCKNQHTTTTLVNYCT